MSASSLQAVQAYLQNAQNIQTISANDPNSAQIGASEAAQNSEFSALVTEALENTTSALTAAENTSAGVVAGDANLVDVVTSISTAEVSLEAAISVRNRMIEAYQEIMRMPI